MTALERQMTADAIALSREHAGRADAAEARWGQLRDLIRDERSAQDQLAADHAEQGRDWTSERAYGRVEALDRLMAVMDEMEAGR